MTMTAGATDSRLAEQRRSNITLLKKLGVIVVGMFGFGYALVPFYDKICEAAGLRNIAQADVPANTQVDVTRAVRIEFDSNVRDLGWSFKAMEPVVSVHPGEVRQVEFEVVNADGARADRAGHPELRARVRRAVFQEDGMLLLRAADAGGGRDAAHARRLRRRSARAGRPGHDYAFLYVLPRRRGQELMHCPQIRRIEK